MHALKVNAPRHAGVARLVVAAAAAAAAVVIGAAATSVAAQPAGSSVAARPALAADAGDWTAYHRDLAGTRYSPLDRITRDNVSRLVVAWAWRPDSANRGGEYKNENTPLVVNGVMYVTTGLQRNVVALDAATGAVKWRWAFEESPARFDNAPRPGAGRGVGYWTDGRTARIFTITPGYRLVALDAATGKPVESFGAKGFVDLKANIGVPLSLDSAVIGNSSPPLVFEDVVVVPPALREGSRPPSYRNVPGRIMAFDARTGALKWRFNTIPAKGEFGYDTWLEGSAEYTGNTGAWAPLSADTKRGWLYVPVEAATGDYYGGHRKGDNLFSSTLVCLDIRTGKRIWHYQLVHHDIWDRDIPTAPILADITVDGRKVEAVAQITKQGWVYVFDRVTGKPVWPIVEKAVPQTDVPGEWTSPTQPFPSKPAPFDVQGITVNDLIDFTPEMRAQAVEAIKPFRTGPLYQPPSLADAPDGTHGTLNVPGAVGGGNWEHGAFDPETGMLYVGSFTNPFLFALAPDAARSDMRYVASGGRIPSVQGLPLLKPPYNRITAINLNTGDHAWMVPGGDTPEAIRNNPALKGIDVGVTGARTRPAVLATKTLLFTTEGFGSGAVLHVLDKKTGARVASIPLPGSVGGTPMTYAVGGRQYVAVWVGVQGRLPAQLIALALP
ncbi:MAG: PQQ-binding-like beta-propeller repeat protein [Gemmatimonadota bacterium]|nr:PQQ-binding-like beta-propeller repeat protein [Gemmatimonadota bacterium]